MSYEDAKSVMWIGLAVLFVVGGLGFGYAMWRAGRILLQLERDLHRTVDEVVPIIVKTGTSMDQINQQLGKVDVMMDSAVDMTEALDTTVRAVTTAVTEPVKKVSGAVAGMTEAVSSFRARVSGDAEAMAARQAAEGAEAATAGTRAAAGASADSSDAAAETRGDVLDGDPA